MDGALNEPYAIKSARHESQWVGGGASYATIPGIRNQEYNLPVFSSISTPRTRLVQELPDSKFCLNDPDATCDAELVAHDLLAAHSDVVPARSGDIVDRSHHSFARFTYPAHLTHTRSRACTAQSLFSQLHVRYGWWAFVYR